MKLLRCVSLETLGSELVWRARRKRTAPWRAGRMNPSLEITRSNSDEVGFTLVSGEKDNCKTLHIPPLAHFPRLDWSERALAIAIPSLISELHRTDDDSQNKTKLHSLRANSAKPRLSKNPPLSARPSLSHPPPIHPFPLHGPLAVLAPFQTFSCLS